MFIDIEGGNASGKTTIIKKMIEVLRDNKKVVYLKSPTSPFSQWRDINDCDILTKYYYFRATAQNESEKIKQLLKQYDIVILERYLYETEAFDLTLEKINNENKIKKHINYKDLLRPNITFFLDINDKIRQKRIEERNNDKNICYWERPEFQKIYNKMYRKIAKRENFTIIDTQKPLLECLNKIVKIINSNFS